MFTTTMGLRTGTQWTMTGRRCTGKLDLRDVCGDGRRHHHRRQSTAAVYAPDGSLKLSDLTASGCNDSAVFTATYTIGAAPSGGGGGGGGSTSEPTVEVVVDGNISRAEFAAILIRSLGLPNNGAAVFDPEASITRQEAMQMIYNAAKLAEYTGKSGALTSFQDAEGVAAWAQTAAQFNVGSGLIVGSDGRLNPTAEITRAETATVVLRLLQNAKLIDVRTNA